MVWSAMWVIARETVSGEETLNLFFYNHPSYASNGLAKCHVQIVKDGLKKITLGSVESWLARLLSCYRVTPQSTTGVSPAELMFGRKLRTRPDLLQLDLGSKVRQQAKQKQKHNAHSKQRGFKVGTTVYVFNNYGTAKWLPGTLKQITGPASVLVNISNGSTFCRHIDDINVRSTQDFHDKNLDADTNPSSADSSTLPTQTVPCHSTRIFRPPNRYV